MLYHFQETPSLQPILDTSSHKAISTSLSSEGDIECIALEECSVSFTNKLDSSAIFAHLIAQHLLTEDDKQFLLSTSRTPREKAKYIIHILPRKADGWFEKLILCLHESADGTGHGDLLRDLQEKRQELRERKNTGITKAPSAGKPEEVQRPVGAQVWLCCPTCMW